MPLFATVKKVFPQQGHGFLKNPNGGKDIFFRFTGHFKDFLGELIHDPLQEAPAEGTRVKVLKTQHTNLGPRATKWTID